MPIIRDLKARLGIEDKASRPLKKTNKQLDKAKKSMAATGRQADRTSRSMGRMGRSAKGLGAKLKGMSSGLKLVAGAVGFGSLAAGMRKAIGDARTFEKSLANVITLLDPADQQKYADALKKGSLRIQREFGFEIETTNKALFDSISAGVEAGKATEFLADASKFARAGVTDISVAVDGLTTVMNAYGKENFDATKAANTFFVAQKFGKTSVQELASNIGKVAGLSATMGATFDETASALSQITLQGVSTEEATTQLQGIFSSLIKVTPQAAKAFNRYGINLKKADGSQRGFAEILKDVKVRVGDNKEALAQMFPNIRALNGVINLTKDGMEGYDNILNSVRTDTESYDAAAKKQMETYDVLMQQFQATITTLAITVGEVLLPPLVKLLKWFTDGEAGIQRLKAALIILGVLMVAAIIPTLYSMGVAMWAALGPIGLIILGIIALGAIVYVFRKQIVDFFIKIWEGIKSFVAFIANLKAVRLYFKALLFPINLLINALKLVWKFGKGLFSGKKTEINVKQDKEAPVRVGGTEKVEDAIITKRGDVIETDPADNIIATKSDPTKAAGGVQIGSLIGTLTIQSATLDEGLSTMKQKVRDALEELSFEMGADLGLN